MSNMNKTMAIVYGLAAIYFTAISIIIMKNGQTILALIDFLVAGMLLASAVKAKRAWDDEKDKRD